MLTGGLGWEKGGAGIGLAGHQGCGWHGAGAGHRLITNHPFITREAGLGWEGERVGSKTSSCPSVVAGGQSSGIRLSYWDADAPSPFSFFYLGSLQWDAKKAEKCRKAPVLCLKSLSCGNKNYKVHVAIDMSIVHCTCVLRFLWHWCLYISFCNFQRGSFAWSFLQPRNILSCVKLKRKYHKI